MFRGYWAAQGIGAAGTALHADGAQIAAARRGGHGRLHHGWNPTPAEWARYVPGLRYTPPCRGG